LAVRGDMMTPEFLKGSSQADLQVVCWTIFTGAHALRRPPRGRD